MKLSASVSAIAAIVSLLLPSFTSAQLSGTVGPTTSMASKSAKKICNVLNYGAKADKKTDIGPAISSAFAACKSGGVGEQLFFLHTRPLLTLVAVYIPAGDYAMATWASLSGGSGFALQLDGIIYRTGTAGGNMIAISNSNDFEMFSSISQGAIQGYGYTFPSQNTYGPRLVRLTKVNNFSFHDIKLVDSPAFHLTMDTCTNGEVYNTIVKPSST